MTERELHVLGRKFPPWTRTPLVLVGLALAGGGVYLSHRVMWHLSQLDAHAAAHSGAGAMLVVAFAAAPTIVLGAVGVELGLVVPGETTVPGFPDLGFSEDQRRLVARGALASVVGLLVVPISLAVLGSVLRPLLPYGFGLGTMTALIGQLFVVMGLGSRAADLLSRR